MTRLALVAAVIAVVVAGASLLTANPEPAIMSIPAEVPAVLLLSELDGTSDLKVASDGVSSMPPADTAETLLRAATLSLLEDSGAAVADVRVDAELVRPLLESPEELLKRATLSLLEDSGAAVAEIHVEDSLRAPLAVNGVSRHEALLSRLSLETSGFRGGVGLEGKALVNGKEFSWANVNLSNISYG